MNYSNSLCTYFILMQIKETIYIYEEKKLFLLLLNYHIYIFKIECPKTDNINGSQGIH